MTTTSRGAIWRRACPPRPARARAPGPLALALALAVAVAAAATLPLAARAQLVDPDPNALPKGDGPLYASAAQVYAAMDRWAAANGRYFSVYKAVDPVSGQSFPVGRFTDTQSSPPSSSSSSRKKRILITCAVHARELIVPEVCLNLLRLLAGTPADKKPVLAWAETTAALKKAGVLASRLTGGGRLTRDPLAPFAASFAQNYELHVAPLINLSGRLLIEQTGKFSQRKTATSPQTDINRNFYFGWSGANTAVSSETYPGAYPASQWETRAMVALMSSVSPHAYADVHSGVAAYLTPLGTTCSQLDVLPSTLPPLQDAADRMLRVVGNITNGPSAALLYTALGTGGDHAYGGAGIESSVTYEVFGGFGTGVNGRGVVCPRLQAWHDKCRLPASSDDPATGCNKECGSDPNMRCKSILAVGASAASAASAAASASTAEPASSSSSSAAALASRAAYVAAARRSGLSLAAARWQAALAEAAAEDPGILVPDGELFWTEFERERERERQQQQGGGGDDGGRSSAAAGEAVPAHLRHLPAGSAELEAALSRRRALRVSLTEQLERLVGGAGAGGGLSGGGQAAAAAAAAAPVAPAADPEFPAWYPLDPCLRHYPNVTSSERSYFTMFNPIQPAQYRKVVADYSASLLVYAAAAGGGGRLLG